MPAISVQTTVAANGTVENILTGSQYEYLPYDALVEFGLVASAVGLVLDVYSGQDIIAEGWTPSFANRIPVYPDDFPMSDVAAAGERLKIRARNTTGGALTLYTTVRISPL